MKKIPVLITPKFERMAIGGDFGNEENGCGRLKLSDNQFVLVIFSTGGGWEHVSASRKDRCPTWDEMCQVKDFFFKPEECVIQFHPPQREYVNNHPFCLHLWKPIGKEIELPPSIMVGFKNV